MDEQTRARSVVEPSSRGTTVDPGRIVLPCLEGADGGDCVAPGFAPGERPRGAGGAWRCAGSEPRLAAIPPNLGAAGARAVRGLALDGRREARPRSGARRCLRGAAGGCRHAAHAAAGARAHHGASGAHPARGRRRAGAARAARRCSPAGQRGDRRRCCCWRHAAPGPCTGRLRSLAPARHVCQDA